MDLFETIRIAFLSLFVNKLRSMLTMLGIIIGVASVVALLSIGRSVRTLVASQLQGLGSNVIYVFAGTSNLDADQRMPPKLSNSDLSAIADRLNVSAVVAAAGEFSNNGITSFSGGSSGGAIVGVSANYAAVSNNGLAIGRFVDQTDIDMRARVAVLGFNVYKNLFQYADPIGEHVIINGMPFEVIGVASKHGNIQARADAKVFVPLSTAQLRLFPVAPNTVRRIELTAITIQVVNGDAIQDALNQVTTLLRTRHNLIYQDNDFTILTQEDLLASFGTIIGAITIFLSAIAAISLLVGGIGVMNVMLMAVSERTREIGLRKAVGARRSDILKQFLIEALALSIGGGIGGIGLGTLLSFVGGRFLNRVAGQLQMQIPPDAILLACGTSVAVGLVFGLYPAIRAARLNPIEALRTE